MALLLIGSAIALWSNDQRQPAAPPVPPISSTKVSSEPATSAFDGDYVLTVSWHPAFCETKPYLAECRHERIDDYSADNFSLHGLWPQDGEYCGIDPETVTVDEANRWDDLAEIDISDATWRDLRRVMPGTEDNLQRHEWVLHGSCAGTDADTFFRRAIVLLEEINRSEVRTLLAGAIGHKVTRTQIRAAFDEAFGNGAGRKVRLDCENDSGRELIDELRINLSGDAVGHADLRDLIQAARSASEGCSGGTVDPVGEQ